MLSLMGDLLQLTYGPSLLKALYHHRWQASRKNMFGGQDCPARWNFSCTGSIEADPKWQRKSERNVLIMYHIYNEPNALKMHHYEVPTLKKMKLE